MMSAGIGLIIGVLFANGCATLKQFIQKPTVEYKGMSIKEMSLFDGSFILNFNVTNPNPIGVPIQQINYDLKINGQNFFRGNLDKKSSLPASGSAVVELPVELSYMDFFKSIVDFPNKDQLEFDVTGSVLVYGFSIPFHATGTFPVPKPPQIALNRVEVKSMSFTSASIVFVVDMINNNPFPVLMDSLDYKIRLAGNDLAGGTAKAIQPLGQNGKSTLELPINLSILKAGQAVLGLLLGPRLPIMKSRATCSFKFPNWV